MGERPLAEMMSRAAPMLLSQSPVVWSLQQSALRVRFRTIIIHFHDIARRLQLIINLNNCTQAAFAQYAVAHSERNGWLGCRSRLVIVLLLNKFGDLGPWT